MNNPFFYGNVVSGDDFCNRKEELKELKKDVDNGLNILIYAPRRFGKTSLLNKLKEDLNNKEYVVIYFDVLSVSSVNEFIQKYFREIIKHFDSTSEKLINFLKNILKLRPNINLSFQNSMEPIYSLSFDNNTTESTLEEVLELPFKYAKKINKKVIVVFDEFQEVKQLDIENKLRSIIQNHGREVSYIFSGSKKSILSRMFNDKGNPFYKSVKHFHIDGILIKDWMFFAKEKFKITGKTIDDSFVDTIFNITQGFPYYMQQLLYVIWENTEKIVNNEIINSSLNIMLEREHDLYSYIWSSITLNQKRVLKYIIKNNGENLYSKDNLIARNITASTLKVTIEALIEKDIVDRKENRFFLVDPFMKVWIQNI